MSTGMKTLGQNTGSFTPSFNVGKAKGGYRPSQLQQFSPEQLNLFQSMFGHLGPDSFLSRLASGDQSQFEQLEAPALRQFQGLQGQLASRFSGLGSGARRSSGFQNTMNQATSDFAQQLQAQRLGLQRQAIGDLMGLSNQLLAQRPYENFLTQKQPSFLKSLLSGGLNAFAGGLGGSLGGNPFGSLFGGNKSMGGMSDSDAIMGFGRPGQF